MGKIDPRNIDHTVQLEDREEYSRQSLSGHILQAIDIAQQDNNFVIPEHVAWQIAEDAAENIWWNIEENKGKEGVTLSQLVHAYCQDDAPKKVVHDKSAN